jgi:acyl-CoA reductase-like NAD-dependent aldehyde dehydrogenase
MTTKIASEASRPLEVSTNRSATTKALPVLVAGTPVVTPQTADVLNPFNGRPVGKVHLAGPEEIEQAITGAVAAFAVTRRLASWERSEILAKISAGLAARREEFARTIALEAGKPIRTARSEVDRAIFTFQVAAEEAKRIYGEIVPLDWSKGNESRLGQVHRVPRGPITAITPFNFPLNLVAHKVAPALACGNPVLLKPAPQTPMTALKLGEVILESGWEPGAISILPTTNEQAASLVEDERIKMLTFTGSPAVGWWLKNQAGRKPVTLELGGNAAVIVHHDADVAAAAARIAWGGFTYAGQACISVQRVYLHTSIYDQFLGCLLPEVRKLKLGDPLAESTDLGPVIDGRAADRIESWINEALSSGAKVLLGGRRTDNLLEPTVLASVPEEHPLSCQEAFGPVINVYRYEDVDDAFRRVNDSVFGLQAGLFTHDLRLIYKGFAGLNVGGLIINDVPTYRMDHMPYGGTKHSGLGREGVRYAIEEMTEIRLLVLNAGGN